MHREGYLFLTLAILTWGGWGFLTKIAAARLHWATTQLLNVIGGILVVLFVCARRSTFQIDRPHLIGILAGVLVALGNMAYFKAIERIPVSVAYPLGSLNLLVPVVFGIALLGEPLTLTKALGVLFALVAMVLLTR